MFLRPKMEENDNGFNRIVTARTARRSQVVLQDPLTGRLVKIL